MDRGFPIEGDGRVSDFPAEETEEDDRRPPRAIFENASGDEIPLYGRAETRRVDRARRRKAKKLGRASWRFPPAAGG